VAVGWAPGTLRRVRPGWRRCKSWRQAVAPAGRFLADLPLRWNGQRILIIGHVATRSSLEVPLEELLNEDFGWQEGWEYQSASHCMGKNRREHGGLPGDGMLYLELALGAYDGPLPAVPAQQTRRG
jgi:hypothetical protein